MPEEYTEVTKVSWGKRIEKSFKGIILGIILFIASFFVLWFNEGRVDFSKIAKLSVPVEANFVDEKAEGKFISVTGKLESNQTIGDPRFLKPGPYIKLVREVEMYAWVEKTETKTHKKVGGEEEKITTYKYVKEWTPKPKDSSTFKYPEGHTNPPMPFWGETFFVETAKVGAYEFSPREADLPQPTPISLNEENVILNGNAKLEGNYIFIGQGTLTNPQIGDVRVSFKGVRTGQTVTLFGKLENGKVEPYYYKENVRLYRVLTGSRDDAISQMAKEYKVNLWLFRGLGFLMMWLGLNLILGPISTFLDVVPILGSISRGLIGVILFVITLILSTITIIISKLFHNVLILLLIVLLVTVGGFFFLKRKRKQET
jgi:hypothetical protein